uniref:Uncharacterized protein n=1 Tax=Oryza sativa subsp. japonica TaxID=39947 RepID=Q8H4F5_ORYSJ|nr:hypothetical protein [Oryza sativa Japonica Group]
MATAASNGDGDAGGVCDDDDRGGLPHVWRLAGIGGEEDSRFRLGPDPARP